MSTVEPPNPLPPDESVGGVLLVLTCILTSFTIITTILRIWARYGRRALGWDDYVIVICCLLAIARTAVQIVSVQRGNGRHRWYISQEDYEYVNFLTWLTQLLLFTNIGLLKCSICMLILRIKNDKALRYFLYAMMAGLIVTNLEPIIILLAECDPPSKYWKPSEPGQCWPTKVRIYSIYVQVAYSVVTDLVCALLPVIVLWNIKITLKAKIGVSGLMSLGLIATAIAIIRASSLGTKTADLSYDYCIAAIWANSELHIGIIATNLALSRMMWQFFRGGPKTMSSKSRPPYASGSNFSKARAGYTKSTDRSPYKEDDLNTRASVDNLSQESEVPLDPGITKTTSIRMSSLPSSQLPANSAETLSGRKHQGRLSEQDEIGPSRGSQNC